LYASFTRAIGDSTASEAALRALLKIHPNRTGEYAQSFERTDRILQTAPTEIPCRTMPRDEHHVIVVLGAGLETNGTVRVKLAARLEQARKLAVMYPKAPLLLTGGNPKGGITEAYAMSQWLTRKGIQPSRLILEDRAGDTVENALYCSAMLQKLGASHVTLITSPSHIHRGLVDLQEACLQRGLSLQVVPLAAAAKGDVHLDPEQERVGVYRDLMRVRGIWTVPGIRR
ncbi:MAG TPA: YdcF family protein, partial [Verrucomicrobiae bacterium]|nr:YdcF family protein [Verrucomicrobiae bacterium]